MTSLTCPPVRDRAVLVAEKVVGLRHNEALGALGATASLSSAAIGYHQPSVARRAPHGDRHRVTPSLGDRYAVDVRRRQALSVQLGLVRRQQNQPTAPLALRTLASSWAAGRRQRARTAESMPESLLLAAVVGIGWVGVEGWGHHRGHFKMGQFPSRVQLSGNRAEWLHFQDCSCTRDIDLPLL